MNKNTSRKKRVRRMRSKITGSGERPRLCVSKSLRFISAQIIDDKEGKTIASYSSRILGKSKNNIQTALKVGKEIAELAKEKKISSVVFDRQGYKFHGRIKAVADGAREGGLKF